MKSMIRRYLARGCATAACIAVLSAPSIASADTIYAVDYEYPSHFGFFNQITGTVVTDGTIGALAPEDILSWDVSRASTNSFGTTITNASSDTGGTLTFSPGALVTTPEGALVFDFGQNFTSSASFGVFLFRPGCEAFIILNGKCGTIAGPSLFFTEQQVHTLGFEIVPTPLLGHGLPGLILASGGLLAWWRGRRKVMNKAKVLAACVCATAASQASAATEPAEALIVFECADFQVSPPEPKDRDPVYKATIKVGWNKNGFIFDISHSTLGGKTYVRSEQYTDTQVRKTPTNITWRGTQFRDPRKTMVGTFDFKAGRYTEMVYSGNQIETKVTARCTVVDSNVGQKKKDQGTGI